MPIAISIVIPTLGNYDGLSKVLGSLERQDATETFEVIVVSDVADPDPGRVRRLVDGRPYCASALTGRRPGASSNRNVGWRAARATLVLFIDNDTLAHPRLISEHLAWHRRHPRPMVGILGHVRWADQVGVTPFMHWLDHGMQFDYPNIAGIDAGWGRFYSANASVKRDLLERVDGFDEVNLPYLYEDLDLSYRASAHGFEVLYNRAAEVEHLRTMDLDFWRKKMPILARAERTFVRLHPEIEPFFLGRFESAVRAAPASGRGRHLILRVPRSLPIVGQAAWQSADLYYRQALAPVFLDAWNSDAISGDPGRGAPRRP